MAPGSAREEVPLLPGQAPRAGHGVDGIVDIDLSRKIYRTAPLGVPASLLAGTLYCIASMSMVGGGWRAGGGWVAGVRFRNLRACMHVHL